MPVLPHKTNEKTWIINYMLLKDGNKVIQKVEFEGSLKEAIQLERELQNPDRKHDNHLRNECTVINY